MRITNMGAPLGTPGYMSPSRRSGGEVDARSDVYAIGAVPTSAWSASRLPDAQRRCGRQASGRPRSIGLRLPLDAEDDARLRASERDSGVHPASRRMPSAAPAALEVPSTFRRRGGVIVERALAKKAEDRFQDARSLLGAIRALRSVPASAPAASST